MGVKRLLVLWSCLMALSAPAQLYKNAFTTNSKPMVPGYALTAATPTNNTPYASNTWGVFKLPHWDPATMGDRPTLLGESNDVIILLRYSGVQPNGQDEGAGDNVIYIGDDSASGKDAISLQMRGFSDGFTNPRLSIVFDEDTYTWRFRPTNLTFAYSDTGADVAIITVNNAASFQVADVIFGITNTVGLTHLQSSQIVIKATSPMGVGMVVNSTGTNAQLGGVLFKDFASHTNHSTSGNFTNFASCTIPANMLTNNGDAVRVYGGGKFLSGTNQFQLGYGSQTNVLDTGSQTNGATSAWNCWAIITRTGNTSQHIEGEFSWNQGNGAPFSRTNFNAEIAETNGIANLLKLAGQAIRAGGITNNSFAVSYEPATR